MGIAYIFLYGPGVRVWRSPPGFEKLTEGSITVFYQLGMQGEAAAVAGCAVHESPGTPIMIPAT